MAQISHGTITITDITDITDVYLIYALALSSADPTAIINDTYNFTHSGERGWNSIDAQIYPQWQRGYQVWIRQVTIKEGAGTVYGTPYLDDAIGQLNEDLSAFLDTQGINSDALSSKLRFMWVNLVERTSGASGWIKPDYFVGTYAASGKYDSITQKYTLDYEDSSTYGYNSFLTNSALNLRYDAINMAQLSTTALTFYRPTINNNQLIQGDKGLMIDATGLKIYSVDNYVLTTDTTPNFTKIYYKRSNNEYVRLESTDPIDNPTSYNYYEISVDAVLDSIGLTLQRGGVQAGSPNGQNFIYLSTENYPSYTINGDTISNLKQIIGTNFGVTNTGALYATDAKIKGIIQADSGVIGSGTNKITIGGTTNAYIYSNTHSSLSNIDSGFYLGSDGISIGDGLIYDNSIGTLSIGNSVMIGSGVGARDVSALNVDITNAATTATNYLSTVSGTTGISVHDIGNVTNFVNITSEGVGIYQNAESVAFFGDSTRIGKIDAERFEIGDAYIRAFDNNDEQYLYFNRDGLHFGSSTGGEAHIDGQASKIRIGPSDNFNVLIASEQLSFMNNNQELAYLSSDKLYVNMVELQEIQERQPNFRMGNFVWNLRDEGRRLSLRFEPK